jgi:hypothetical protein
LPIQCTVKERNVKDIFGCEVPDAEAMSLPVYPKDQAECQEKADALAKLMGPKWKGEGQYPDGDTKGQPIYFWAKCGPVTVAPFTPCLSAPFKYYTIWIDGLQELMESIPKHTPTNEDPKQLLDWVTQMREWAAKVAMKCKEAGKVIGKSRKTKG